jgi:hypothetical protein
MHWFWQINWLGYTRVARCFIFKPKIPIWLNLEGLRLEYFTDISDIFWPFGTFCVHLVLFVFIWYIFSGFGIMDQEKSGNSGLHFGPHTLFSQTHLVTLQWQQSSKTCLQTFFQSSRNWKKSFFRKKYIITLSFCSISENLIIAKLGRGRCYKIKRFCIACWLKWRLRQICPTEQGCQIFCDTIIPKLRKMYQMTTKLPNGRNVFQMALNYTNIFHFKALQNLPLLGFLVWKCTVWQTCYRNVLCLAEKLRSVSLSADISSTYVYMYICIYVYMYICTSFTWSLQRSTFQVQCFSN